MSLMDDSKQRLREQVWNLLNSSGVVESDVYGKIPDFTGASQTADRLAALPSWQRAGVVKANPDAAQWSVRARALRERKLLFMAVPKMADPRPFYRLEPAVHVGAPEQLAQPGFAADHSPRVSPEDIPPVDIVICGSVAVDRTGSRLGKGAGYSDLEVALLTEAGCISDETLIVAPVHPLQIIDEPIPAAAHDFSVDVIVTPDEVIQCPRRPRPNGIVWANLTHDKINAIPALAARNPALSSRGTREPTEPADRSGEASG